MTVFSRSIKKTANAKWQYEENHDMTYSNGKQETGFERAIYRFRKYPEEYKAWAIIRVSDMRILAQSKGYAP